MWWVGGEFKTNYLKRILRNKIMLVKFFTLHYDKEKGNFDDDELQEFIKNKTVVSVSDQFFTPDDNTQCWGIMLCYKHGLANNKAKTSSRSKKDKDAYKKELDGEKDWELFEKLREWRQVRTSELSQPPYIIADNIMLAKITHNRPVTLQALKDLNFGEIKCKKYGKEICDIIRKFEENKDA